VALTGLTVAGCADLGRGSSHIDLSASNTATVFNFGNIFSRGDTITFRALEITENLSGSTTIASSDQDPSLYGWLSDDSTVMKVIAPGRVVMVGSGQAHLVVKSPHASANPLITVVGPHDALRLTPETMTVAVGATATMDVFFVDSAGARWQWNTFSMDFSYEGKDPVNSANNYSGLTAGWFIPKAAGEITYIASVPVAGRYLRDTVFITAK
jgi:hypothetical protein